MALLNDILKWSQSELKLWQQDALRRLLVSPESALTDQDWDDLYVLLRAEHGLPNPRQLEAAPLSAEDLPANPGAVAPVILKAMRDAKHLNRLAEEQTLLFAPTGLTVIFGGNGSGKSGYARALKRACRARDHSEPVHPDASDSQANERVPEVTFDVVDRGKESALTWRRGVIPPEPLSTIAVFDSHCARVYLTSEQEAAILPYGLSAVEGLGSKVLPRLKGRLDAERASLDVDTAPFAHLRGDSVVGRLIANLDHKTDVAKISALAGLRVGETSRLTELERLLKEPDPKTRANNLRTQGQRMKEILTRLDNAHAWVKEEAIQRLNNLMKGVTIATQAELLAAKALRADEDLLPGTGEQVWRDLFEAARRFSEDVAYAGYAFPHTDAATCVLCQQPLNEGAQRLTRFEQFLKADTAKAAEKAREELAAGVRKISGAVLSHELPESTRDELEILDAGLPALVLTFERCIEDRRAAMLRAASTGEWGALPLLAEDPRHRLSALVDQLNQQASSLDKAADPGARQRLERERDDLIARQKLSLILEPLVALVERMKLRKQMESCETDLKTHKITAKSKEFATIGVNQALAAALEDEFQRLGVGHIKTKLIPRGDKSKNKYRLGLDLPATFTLEEVLSEGEQRSIAIGCFLAELRQFNHKGAVVFDDPVSSLDHWRRQHVARRLTEEARDRQVIVFTHDTVFLALLRDAAEHADVDFYMQNLEWRGGKPGVVVPGLPWDHQPYTERLEALARTQCQLEENWPAYPSASDTQVIREQYSLLRSTIERVIQDVVLAGVVRRHHDYVKTGDLQKVVGFPASEEQAYARLIKRCHQITEAHDPSSAQHLAPPTAADLGADLAALRSLIKTTKARQKAMAN
ncbi:MAG: AAA family ATPase [Betaproteobacteria bacterium]|nr:AAA family ATPase [Betaproteobacteria bacterium]MDE2153149.1 AAA family ATPase [Betaproteobacteria bacterium]MDE2478533.1 AAA family ATPase [Betaproteobacteria bacterium]